MGVFRWLFFCHICKNYLQCLIFPSIFLSWAEHRGLGGQTLHAHHPLVPQYLKKKLGRRKSIPPSASHPAHLHERNFTPDFRALMDAPASFSHVLPPVSEQTEPVEGEDSQVWVLSINQSSNQALDK